MKRKAFTLIELLVVIAIIAILAAILFPVFAQAKAAAKQTVSVSNMKQVGTAAMLYLSDNDDQNPQGDDYAEWLWPFLFYGYAKNVPQDKAGGKNTIYWSPLAPGDMPQYLAGDARIARVQELGLDKQFNLKLGQDPNGVVAYAFWSTTSINESLAQEWPNMSSNVDPANVIYFTEAADTEIEADEVAELYGRTQKCNSDDKPKEYEKWAHEGGHNGGVNYTWTDGHVKWRKTVVSEPSEDAGISSDLADRTCHFDYYVFPPGGQAGIDNCEEWSPLGGKYEPLERYCIR